MGWDSGSQAWGGAAASGGGGGAAAPLVTLPYKNLDLTSGHTLVEPDGLTISGVAIDSGTKVMTFTMNELATGDAPVVAEAGDGFVNEENVVITQRAAPEDWQP